MTGEDHRNGSLACIGAQNLKAYYDMCVDRRHVARVAALQWFSVNTKALRKRPPFSFPVLLSYGRFTFATSKLFSSALPQQFFPEVSF